MRIAAAHLQDDDLVLIPDHDSVRVWNVEPRSRLHTTHSYVSVDGPAVAREALRELCRPLPDASRGERGYFDELRSSDSIQMRNDMILEVLR
jgi:hypothetical protein